MGSAMDEDDADIYYSQYRIIRGENQWLPKAAPQQVGQSCIPIFWHCEIAWLEIASSLFGRLIM